MLESDIPEVPEEFEDNPMYAGTPEKAHGFSPCSSSAGAVGWQFVPDMDHLLAPSFAVRACILHICLFEKSLI